MSDSSSLFEPRDFYEMRRFYKMKSVVDHCRTYFKNVHATSVPRHEPHRIKFFFFWKALYVIIQRYMHIVYYRDNCQVVSEMISALLSALEPSSPKGQSRL